MSQSDQNGNRTKLETLWQIASSIGLAVLLAIGGFVWSRVLSNSDKLQTNSELLIELRTNQKVVMATLDKVVDRIEKLAVDEAKLDQEQLRQNERLDTLEGKGNGKKQP